MTAGILSIHSWLRVIGTILHYDHVMCWAHCVYLLLMVKNNYSYGLDTASYPSQLHPLMRLLNLRNIAFIKHMQWCDLVTLNYEFDLFILPPDLQAKFQDIMHI